MDPGEFLKWAGWAVSLAVAVYPVVRWCRRGFRDLWAKVQQLLEMYHELHELLKYRAELEAVEKGLATSKDGVLMLRADVRARFEPIASRLRALAAAENAYDSATLTTRISQEFNPWLFKNICLHYGVRDLACLRLAIAVARETPTRAAV